MNLFKKSKEKAYPLALKNGDMIAMAGENLAEGTELAPMGAMTLEDGEYELADGRKIVVAGSIVKEIKEPEAKKEEDEETEAIVEAVVASVTEVIIAETAKITKDFDAKLAKISSAHTVVKGKDTKAKADDQRDMSAKVQDSIQAKLKENRTKIVEGRTT